MSTLLQTEPFDEVDCIRGHLREGGRDFSRRASDAGVVEENDLTLFREPVRYGRGPTYPYCR